LILLAQYEYLYDNLVLSLESINLDTKTFDTVLAVYYIRDIRQESPAAAFFSSFLQSRQGLNMGRKNE
jgi:hypothetical protein